MYCESELVVRYAETDQMGIVHHSVYPIWYEIARTDFIKKLGMTYSNIEAMGIMTPLVNLNCHYLRPACYEDILCVRAWISKLTPAKIEFSYEIYKKETLISTGTTLHAWVGKDLKPMNIKKNFPNIYEKLQESL
ncbi:MAG: acyl-CoA thioesterase [Clostridia bacterium]|nr:acyl-CoA thioesterase [Clostridia bacterium]